NVEKCYVGGVTISRRLLREIYQSAQRNNNIFFQIKSADEIVSSFIGTSTTSCTTNIWTETCYTRRYETQPEVTASAM
ncbi:hypothetical protein, partial [Vibrio anguillarum]